MKYRWGILFILMLSCLNLSATYDFELDGREQKKTTTSSSISISGAGFLGNIRLKRALSLLEPLNKKEITINSSYLEDALWILSGELNNQGYGRPTFSVKAYKRGRLVFKSFWDKSFTPSVPNNLEADSLDIEITEGELDFYNTVKVKGAPPFLSKNQITNYFYPTNYLFLFKGSKFYTKKRLKKSTQNLLDALKIEGYQNAYIESQQVTVNKENHGVDLNLKINPGPQFYVHSIRVFEIGGLTRDIPSDSIKTQIYSNNWTLDYIQQLRIPYLQQGYPNTQIETVVANKEVRRESAWVDLEFTITPGDQIHIGHISWKNAQGKIISPVVHRAKIKDGELLNILEVQAERDRLYALGIFDSVDIEYTPIDDTTWDVSFICKPLDPYSISLIAGWGSYELLRLGFEIEHYNLFGLAHNGRLRVIQSLKATQGEYRYNIPNFQGRPMNVFGQLNYLEREEKSHTDRRYGPTIGTDFFLKKQDIYASIAYKLEVLEVKKQQFLGDEGRNESRASAFELAFNQNKLDNALYPEKGYQWFTRAEFAFEYIGGNVNYERIEAGGAYHKDVGSGLIFHTGIKSGVLLSPESIKENVPINKRFRLGGENTLRGFQQGEASPVDKDGKLVGAESYTLLNIQLEQKILPKLSFVVFSDIAGMAKDISDYPFTESFISIGAGISIQTLVGPLRFEYGRNIKKRDRDPSGTFHFSIGAPF